MMVKANFYSEAHLAEHASLGGKAKQQSAPLPRLLHCDYVTFCRWLVQKHGEGYLLRPDGEPLVGVPDAAFVVPVPKVVKPAPVLLPPPLPVSVAPEIKRSQGAHPPNIRDTIVRVLTANPQMGLQEIETKTGLTREQVRRCLGQWSGTYFRHRNRKWEVIQNTAEVDV